MDDETAAAVAHREHVVIVGPLGIKVMMKRGGAPPQMIQRVC